MARIFAAMQNEGCPDFLAWGRIALPHKDAARHY
jgi:hypothetical protein